MLLESIIDIQTGLLDDEEGDVDLSVLEKKLTERRNQQSRQASLATTSSPASPSQAASAPSATDGAESTPQSSFASPAPIIVKDEKKPSSPGEDKNPGGPEEVEALSEMMCSLVTNNYGETRFIGWLSSQTSTRFVC